MMAAAPLPTQVGRPDDSSGANLQMPPTNSIARMRTELLETFLGQMNKTQIPYCLLDGFQGNPEVISSDVDFMVRPNDATRIAPLLLKVARRCGALMVQAIRHETGASYFVLAKQAGGAVAYLHPDCSTDYRRDGRLWMEAEQVIARRQRFKSFFVPVIADEFLYYLTKKTLKQSITNAQWQRIMSLYLSNPRECRNRMRGVWSDETAEDLVAAFLRDEIGWMKIHLPALLSELQVSPPVESWQKRLRQSLREWRRGLERVANPTGLSVAVCRGTTQQRAELAKMLEQNLRPAFRRTMICEEESVGDGLWSAIPVWRAKLRSTLVIRKKEATNKEWLVGDEIEFVLSDGEAANKRHFGEANDGYVFLDRNRPPAQTLEHATRITLHYLAARLQRRMNLGGLPCISTESDA